MKKLKDPEIDKLVGGLRIKGRIPPPTPEEKPREPGKDFYRIRRVLQLKQEGKTYKEIGLELGISKQRACAIYKENIEKWPGKGRFGNIF